MHGAEFLIPISFFAAIFGIFYIKSRENLALIERGINPKSNNSVPRPYVSLKYGLLLTGAGIGLLLAFFIDRAMQVWQYSSRAAEVMDHNPAIYFALIAIGGGLGLVFSYRIEKRWLDRQGKE